MRPLQETGAFYSIKLPLVRDHRTIGQIAYFCVVRLQALAMQFGIKFINSARPHKRFCLLPAAEKARPVATRQGRHLIHEEHRRVTPSHGFVMGTLPFQLATNPMGAGPAALAQRLVIAVKLSTAIAHHQATRRNGYKVTVWQNAVLQGHGKEPER